MYFDTQDLSQQFICFCSKHDWSMTTTFQRFSSNKCFVKIRHFWCFIVFSYFHTAWVCKYVKWLGLVVIWRRSKFNWQHTLFLFFFILRESSTKDVAGSLFLCQNGQSIITLDLDTEVLWQRWWICVCVPQARAAKGTYKS